MSVRVHYVLEMGDWLAVCGSEDDYQTWRTDDVTCPLCQAEL